MNADLNHGGFRSSSMGTLLNVNGYFAFACKMGGFNVFFAECRQIRLNKRKWGGELNCTIFIKTFLIVCMI